MNYGIRKLLLPLSIALATSLSLSGCLSNDHSGGGGGGSNNNPLDIKLNTIIANLSLTGNPMTGRSVPDISSKNAQLGMRLFFSKSLGGDRDSACVTCHHPALGGGDNLSLPIGTGAVNPDLLGPGRLHDSSAVHYDGGPTVPRNAPTTFNIAGWDSELFLDGRVESLGKTPQKNGDDGKGIRTPDSALNVQDTLAGDNLAQAQARFPITSPEEMKGFNNDDKNNQQIRDYLASRFGGYGSATGELSDTSYWLAKFRDVFNKPAGTAEELITEQNISFLIGEYERSQVLVDSPWKRFVDGDSDALSETAKKGAVLFFGTIAEGGANCASCHSGDLFTDEAFHNVAMPQIGRGKGNGADKSDDFGRFRETGKQDDLYAFRTPSLLNVEVTGPWSHAGAYTSLEAVVKHMADPVAGATNYDTSQLTQTGVQNLDKVQINTQKAVAKLEADRQAGKDVIESVSLTDAQVNELVAFLKALTDPCTKDRSCLAKWIIDPVTDADPNGDQLNAVDANANPL